MDTFYCFSEQKILCSTARQERWKELLQQYGIVYLHAMTGFGKTVAAQAFAAYCYKIYGCFSARQENCVAEISAFLQQKADKRCRRLVIIDDLQWLEETKQQAIVAMIARTRRDKVDFFLLSRAPLPAYLKSFFLTRQLATIDNTDLAFSEPQLQYLMEQNGLQNTAAFRRLCTEGRGYPPAIYAIISYLKHGKLGEQGITKQVIRNICESFAENVCKEWPLEITRACILLAVFPKFTADMAQMVLQADASTMLARIIGLGSGLVVSPDEVYSFDPFFCSFLQQKQKALPEEEYRQLYRIAAQCYEQKRDFSQALHCYMQAQDITKIAQLIVYLMQNTGGCGFAREAAKYLPLLPQKMREESPRLLAAQVELLSCQMKPDESDAMLEKLRLLAEADMNQSSHSETLEAYLSALVSLPHGKSGELVSKCSFATRYILKNGIKINGVMATSNMPSLVDGGLDLCAWIKNAKLMYHIGGRAIVPVLGKENAAGLPDIAYGELLYERNSRMQAIGYLTKGLSDASLHDNLRGQYVANGVMARLFLAENQSFTAQELLANTREKIELNGLVEMLPNIDCSLLRCKMREGDAAAISAWVENSPPTLLDDFYITDRYQLMTKAMAYISQSRYAQALTILKLLEQYTTLYHRTYLRLHTQLIMSIVFYRTQGDWRPLFIKTICECATLGFVRLPADEGAALLPLFDLMDWGIAEFQPHKDYCQTVLTEMKAMAGFYPQYLQEQQGEVHLSRQELNILHLLEQGLTNPQIAEKLFVSVDTIKFHVSNILKKLQAKTRTEAVCLAKQSGLL